MAARPSRGPDRLRRRQRGGARLPDAGRAIASAARSRATARRSRTLPDSVEHVVVIRDSVKAKTATNGLRAPGDARPPGGRARVRAAARAAAARGCGGRGRAPAGAAPRGGVIDLTSFQCSARYCFPVVGGVLVHKDIDHITRQFATTLAPYLLRDYDRLAAAWPPRLVQELLVGSRRPCASPRLQVTRALYSVEIARCGPPCSGSRRTRGQKPLRPCFVRQL